MCEITVKQSRPRPSRAERQTRDTLDEHPYVEACHNLPSPGWRSITVRGHESRQGEPVGAATGQSNRSPGQLKPDHAKGTAVCESLDGRVPGFEENYLHGEVGIRRNHQILYRQE